MFRNRYHDDRDFEIRATLGNTNVKGIFDTGIHMAKLKRTDESSGARFGSSLLNLGRFDGDKYEDFAVGAPFKAL